MPRVIFLNLASSAGKTTLGRALQDPFLLLGEQVRDDWLDVLRPFQPFLVAVDCSIEELERRERARTGRPGLARWSARQAHIGVSYDLTVDTTSATAEDLAAVIAKRMS